MKYHLTTYAARVALLAMLPPPDRAAAADSDLPAWLRGLTITAEIAENVIKPIAIARIEADKEIAIERIRNEEKNRTLRIKNDEDQAKLDRWLSENRITPEQEKHNKLVSKAYYDEKPVTFDTVTNLNLILQDCINLDAIYDREYYKAFVKERCNLSIPEALELKKLHVNTPITGGNAGLLKGGSIPWPLLLKDSFFEGDRQRLEDLLITARDQAIGSPGGVDNDVIKGISDSRLRLEKLLLRFVHERRGAYSGNGIGNMYIDSYRFLKGSLPDFVKMVTQPDAKKYLLGEYSVHGKDIPELVRNMRDNGLRFAKPTPGSENSYTTMYQLLVNYSRALRAAHQEKFQKKD